MSLAWATPHVATGIRYEPTISIEALRSWEQRAKKSLNCSIGADSSVVAGHARPVGMPGLSACPVSAGMPGQCRLSRHPHARRILPRRLNARVIGKSRIRILIEIDLLMQHAGFNHKIA